MLEVTSRTKVCTMAARYFTLALAGNLSRNAVPSQAPFAATSKVALEVEAEVTRNKPAYEI